MAFYRCGGGLPTQQKNNEVAKTTNLVVTPDDGYVLEKVTVAPTPSEPGSATAPLSGSVEYPAPSGKYFNKFTVTATPSTSSYEITAGTSDKTITSPSGSLISGGTVHPTPSYQGTGTAPLTGTSSAITPTSGNHFSSFKITATPSVSDYSITAGTTSKAITHPTGKLIFSGTVNPTPSEPGSGTAPLSGTTPFTPTEGKYFSSFTVTATPSQSNYEITAGTADKTITPPTGKLISGGTVHPTPTESLEVTAPITGSTPYEPHEGKFFSDATIFASPSVTNYEITANTSDKSITLPMGRLIAGGTVHPTPSYARSETALTTEKTYTPTTGNFFSEFTIKPQKHTDTTPVAITTRTSNYDLGSIHNKRYINTNGVPSTYDGWHTAFSGVVYDTSTHNFTNTISLLSGYSVLFKITYNTPINTDRHALIGYNRDAPAFFVKSIDSMGDGSAWFRQVSISYSDFQLGTCYKIGDLLIDNTALEVTKIEYAYVRTDAF